MRLQQAAILKAAAYSTAGAWMRWSGPGTEAPLGIVSWFGKSRSYEVRLSCRVRPQV